MDQGKEPAATPAIAVGRICKSIGQQLILSEISFEIAAGELLVVLGPSGSGKTTLLRIIAGLDRADSGDVGLHGARLLRLSPAPSYAETSATRPAVHRPGREAVTGA